MRRSLLGSLLVVLAATLALAAPARAADPPTEGLRYPSLTPDGEQVVFGYRGDIWIARVDGQGAPRRLTIHEAQDTLPRVSPDGKLVAFSSLRGGGYDLYVVPVDGGMPRQVTFHGGPEILCGWSPDGKRLLFMGMRDPSMWGMDLYEVEVEGGTPRRVTRDGGRDGAYGPDGHTVVYARGFNTIYQDDYEGSANYDLMVVDAPGGLPRVLTSTPRNERHPFFSADGKTVWFVAEQDGVANFFAMAADGSGEPRQLTRFAEDVMRPDVARDGHTVVFERAGRLWTLDLAAETPAPKALDLRVRSDVRHSGVEIRDVRSGAEHVSVTRDGQTVVFSAQGDLWSMPAGGGAARRLTSSPAKEEWPRPSPDGRTIAFQSDEGGNSDVWLLDLATGRRARATKNPANDFFQAWSPDGKRLVFSSERSGNRDIWALDLESGEEHQLTRHAAADDDPVYSPDGAWIAFDSGRDGAQAIYVMRTDGSDVRRVTGGGGFFQVPTFSPDGSMIAFEGYNPQTGASGGIFVVSASGGAQVEVSRDGTGACWSPAGDWIYFAAERGDGGSQIYRVRAPTSVEPGELVPFFGKVEVDLRTELAGLFDEAWQLLRDGFYDEKMHGVDWDAVKKRYRDLAIDAENKDEFQNVIRQMLAELGASHLGIGGGYRSQSVTQPHPVETGQLGVELEDGEVEGGGRRVASVLADGPADQAGLRVGDVVLAIGRTRLKPTTDLDQVLAGTVGDDVRVTFRPITADGLGEERSLTVKPAGLRALGGIVERQWLQRNARLVKEGTKGHAGYIHLDAMDPQNLQRFQQAVARWNQDDKIEGMVLDVRNNGGGNIHVQLMEILTARPFMQVQPRGAPKPIVQPTFYWDKPVVVLINERSFSDAEVFPYAFQTLGRGKVVGVPTPGGVIGTNDVTLSDGSRFRIPRTKLVGMDGRNLEGLGVSPDVLVEETSEDRRAGRDPQLLAAIDVLVGEMRAARQAAPTTPAATPTAPAAPTAPPAPRAEASALFPLADARAGEWVRYRMAFGGEETVLRVEVREVTDDHVRFAKEIESGGAQVPVLPDDAPRRPVLEILPLAGEVRGHQVVTAEVGGATAEAVRVDVAWAGTPVVLVFTNAVPGLGLWRAELGGQVVLEAIAWGEGEAPPVPPADPSTAAPPGGEATAGEAAAFVDPIEDARPGEWIRVRQATPEGDALLTIRVVEVTDDEVVLETEVERDGQHAAGPPMRRPRRGDGGRGDRGDRGEATVEHATLDLAGRTLSCVVLTTSGRRGTLRRWYCPDVPATGLVRVERDGRVIREAVDWGVDEGSPTATPGAHPGS